MGSGKSEVCNDQPYKPVQKTTREAGVHGYSIRKNIKTKYFEEAHRSHLKSLAATQTSFASNRCDWNYSENRGKNLDFKCTCNTYVGEMKNIDHNAISTCSRNCSNALSLSNRNGYKMGTIF